MNFSKCPCGTEGYVVGATINCDDAFTQVVMNADNMDEGDKALFTYANQDLCFICLAKATNTCVGCLDVCDTLYAESRCNARPYVCRTCLKKNDSVHLNSCYSDGCMSPGELAKEELDIMNMLDELKRDIFGDEQNSEGSEDGW